MDRRARKTKKAIIEAFSRLLAQKSYAKITVQDLIDEADVGRTTFYAHFETKDALLQELVTELFNHVFPQKIDLQTPDEEGLVYKPAEEVVSHLLLHFLNPKISFVALLSSESASLFSSYFKNRFGGALAALIALNNSELEHVPQDFVANHASSAFLGMVEWWHKHGLKQQPEELAHWFVSLSMPVPQS